MNELMKSKGCKPRKGVVLRCICGKDFYKRQSSVRKSNYCSTACKSLEKKGRVNLECKICKSTYSTYKSHVKHRGSSYCSMLCMGKGRTKFYCGSNGPSWKGGISKVNRRLRASKRFKDWRVSVFTRDDYTCQMCGVRGGYLEPDHIKPFAYFPEDRFDIDNGRTLCRPCHMTTDTWGQKARNTYEAVS